MNKESAGLLIHCRDQPGLIAEVTRWIQQQGGNIIDLDEHVDPDAGMFFMRVTWMATAGARATEDLANRFEAEIAVRHRMSWKSFKQRQKQRVALLVSKQGHCLHDILARWQSRELRCEIPLILSNHESLRSTAERFGLAFHCLPSGELPKEELEARQQALLEEQGIDCLVLARYMQILSPAFVSRWQNRIINIHHSFLPAFPGARPYHQAHARGVKLIGATAHYVSDELDAGPIIDQEVTRISHRDTATDLVRKGKDLEKVVLSRALRHHLENQVLCWNNRTVVFD